MKINTIIIFILLFFNSCGKVIDCNDAQIQPSLISFPMSTIDTLVIRKFKANDNYQNLIDTQKIIRGSSGQYVISNDTTSIFIADRSKGITVGFDWKIYIPSINRTIFISNISSEKNTTKCGNIGEPFGCSCTNNIYSLKKDNQIVTFANPNIGYNYIYIHY